MTLSAKSKILFTAASLLASVGCARLSDDGGFDAVAQLASERGIGRVAWNRDEPARSAARERTRALLGQSLDADTAVEIALLNNRGLQASLAELGIAEADLVQTGTLPNPKIAFTKKTQGNETSIERAFTFDVLGIVLIPLALEIEERRFAQAQSRAALDLLLHAGEVRSAYYEAVAARQVLEHAEQVKDAAEAGAMLGKRMVEVGNWSRLARAREQAIGLEASNYFRRARLSASAAEERLIRLLGLKRSEVSLKLPDRLPNLPALLPSAANLEATALDRRLDVRMAKLEIEGLAKSLGLTQATRFINVLDASYLRNSENNNRRETGYEIELMLPLFDWGGARVAKAEHLYAQAVERVADIALAAQSEVRERLAAHQATHEIAKRYRDEVVPLRAEIAEEILLRYNGMLTSVFELLAETREQIGTVVQSIEALRDFWIADTELMVATSAGTMAASRARSLPFLSLGKGRAGH